MSFLGPGFARIPSPYREELESLVLLWNERVDATLNGASGHLHTPPSMAMFSSLLARECAVDEHVPAFDSIESAEEWHGWFNTMLTAFGSTMFEYGQLCSARGLLVANLEPCKCEVIPDTVEDLLNPSSTPVNSWREMLYGQDDDDRPTED